MKRYLYTYAPLWQTLKDGGVSQYQLLQGGITSSQLNRLRRNESITLKTLKRLCETLQCRVSDIMIMRPEEEIVEFLEEIETEETKEEEKMDTFHLE
ncbi:MAG: helix-turn-helix transcriptional regulator [Oribacterium sp.]|nr:helix-turn-helix transcriptional regulator [Oribacterium sp.]MDY6306804.1 helix-turn-helix transcriptional regulator [Oribacterium sp.]MDY6316376.1 helix-turn-helix transcriptional regulator [Oribacterium sp.]